MGTGQTPNSLTPACSRLSAVGLSDERPHARQPSSRRRPSRSPVAPSLATVAWAGAGVSSLLRRCPAKSPNPQLKWSEVFYSNFRYFSRFGAIWKSKMPRQYPFLLFKL
ncbi:hypothetical protein AAHA92_21867 [Salvia divinorum]|uniref:Uncharacterized protein n=1 Tax=Salvia divinorum TaxID=28513 RepID=A0ABD1GM52_SALDI